MKMPLLRLLSVISLMLCAQFVLAHTGLKQATPAADAIVAVPPATIELVFTEAVKLVRLQIMAPDHEMPSSFEPNATAQAAFSFETPGMHAGTFTINWAIIGADGHPISNSYRFTVDPAAAASASN